MVTSGSMTEHAPPEDEQPEGFDFDRHRRAAVEQYLAVREKYERFASTVRDILAQALEAAGTRVHSIEARAKDPESFGAKAELRSEANPGEPRYHEPLHDITDLAGVRVITFFPRTVDEVGTCIRSEFEVIEHMDLGRTLIQEERFGYQSEHYLVRLTGARTPLPEYE